VDEHAGFVLILSRSLISWRNEAVKTRPGKPGSCLVHDGFNHETWGITLLIMGIYDDLWGFMMIYGDL